MGLARPAAVSRILLILLNTNMDKKSHPLFCMWDVITHPYHNFVGGITKPLLKLWHGWVIVSKVWVDVITYPCNRYGTGVWYTNYINPFHKHYMCRIAFYLLNHSRLNVMRHWYTYHFCYIDLENSSSVHCAKPSSKPLSSNSQLQSFGLFSVKFQSTHLNFYSRYLNKFVHASAMETLWTLALCRHDTEKHPPLLYISEEYPPITSCCQKSYISSNVVLFSRTFPTCLTSPCLRVSLYVF